MKNETHSGEELKRFAARFTATLEPRERALVVALSGELGAGKTTFTQGVAEALGVRERVTSPTFVVEKVYELHDQKWRRLIHIDAYRLEGAHELQVLGWDELIGDPGNLIVLEWPERVAQSIPSGAIRMKFDIAGERRTITW